MSKKVEYTPEQLEYFEELEVEKQVRYERRIAREILSGMGFSNVMITHIDQLAAEKTGLEDGFTPEWVSDHLFCPITFMAVKDFQISKKDGFPDLVWFLNHGTFGKFASVFTRTWEEAKSRFNSEAIAVCVRPEWAERTLVFHNYMPVTRYAPGVRNAPARLLWPREDGMIVMHYLRDLLKVLCAHWKPTMPLE